MTKKTTRQLPREARVFGGNLKAAREEKGLTQYDIAKKTGIAQPDISAIEAGDQNITIIRMAKLAKAVGKSLSELFI